MSVTRVAAAKTGEDLMAALDELVKLAKENGLTVYTVWTMFTGERRYVNENTNQVVDKLPEDGHIVSVAETTGLSFPRAISECVIVMR